jgi:hypothetical protein
MLAFILVNKSSVYLVGTSGRIENVRWRLMCENDESRMTLVEYDSIKFTSSGCL